MNSWESKPLPGYLACPVGDTFIYIHEVGNIAEGTQVGRGSYIAERHTIGGEYPVQVGKFCSVGQDFYCWTRENHQTAHASTAPLRSMLGMALDYPEIAEEAKGVTIGSDVWIGHDVRLMPGVTIGDGAVVGARALVTKDLEPYGIYGGVPARLIRKRFADAVIAALLDLKWWDWPIDKIKRNVAFFNLDLTTIGDAKAIYAAIVD